MSGSVSLIGAGPGDPELLTRRAAARLRRADLVLFDALVDGRVLRLARRAEQVFVGKRVGQRAIAQGTIHALMIDAAQRGRYVVRLKGGDPLVFGRGGEEALALQAAGVPFEIIPGISSATAAPAAAGIPATHRGFASGFVVISGHSGQSVSTMLAAIAPNMVTLIVLMGLQGRHTLTADLLARGWRADLPAAVVLNAWCTGQHVWRGVLAQMPQAIVQTGAPGTIVIGETAALHLHSPFTPARLR